MTSKASFRAFATLICALLAVVAGTSAAQQQPAEEVDTALLLAVDVSQSVDAERYRLQMEGIALALEDQSVINAITTGPKAGILLSLVTWADKADVQIPWKIIRSADDARAFADTVRGLEQKTGEYTCVARMMEAVNELMVDDLPAMPSRVVVDVSGDGIDNCARPNVTLAARDALLARRIAINGLPILGEGENDHAGSGAYRAPGFDINGEPIGPGTSAMSIDAWYRDHVIGGPGAFLLTAQGFEDFGRAFRQKFVTEVSSAE